MISRHGPAFTFWLNYLNHHGGLWEQAGDTVLAMLPDRLVATHDLPESALITDDPDIAREDGVLFLGAGNPEIDKGAEAVVELGDVGTLTVAHRTKQIVTEDLLAKIRDQVPVDHGRIDATGSILRSHRAQLRLGALVSHTVSADEQFTEVVECVLDVPSRVAWPQAAADRLLSAVDADEPAPGPDAPPDTLATAAAAAHRELDALAARRGRELSKEADAERLAEIARATEYYAAALASIDKRRTNADGQRQSLLDARTEATIGERDRRLAEIDEKYRHQHALRPYRLHLIDVPVWRLATDVRRGERRWPMVFDYLPQLGTVAPTRCPTCGAHAELVATKTHLRCVACVPVTAPPAPLPPVAEKPKPEPAPRKVAAPPRPTTRPTVEPKTPARVPSGPFLPGKPEDRKISGFWDHICAGDTRKLSRLIAADSPLAALVRLYRTEGPLRGIGVPAGQTPVSYTFGHYDQPVSGNRGGTAGELHTHRGQYPYLLLWSPDKLLEEVLPYSQPWHPGRAQMFPTSLKQAPTPRADLDVVAQLLLARVAARHDLTFAARALAAWWRLPDPDGLLARFSPGVLAATVNRAVQYWSGTFEAGYPESAALFQVDQADMRKATPVLQRHLQLTATRNW